MAHESATSGQLAQTPPGAFRRRDRIAWAQTWMPFVALLCVGAFWCVDWHRQAEARYSPGPLAEVHATWDDRCAVCHATAEPLSGNNWTSLVKQHSHAADQQCLTCHDGPIHHANQEAQDVPGCAACHQEHRGRSRDLKAVASEQCVRCHTQLSHHVEDGAPTKFLDVHAFTADGHPEVRLLRDKAGDPGHVAFNHHLHLAPGLREQTDSTVPFTLADVPAAWRERYRRPNQADADPVRLDCAACHRTERDAGPAPPGVPASALQPPRPAGDYMLPIVYEMHCQACHPLTFLPRQEKGAQAAAPPAPHRLQPEELRAWLRGFFTSRLLQDQLPLLELPSRPLPGKNPEREAAAKKVGQALTSALEAAERILHGPSTCGKCHTSLQPGLGVQQRVAAPNIPTIWFEHARFDHTAHRGVACRACHPQAETSRSHGDVLIPGRDLCLTCHAPPGRNTGGARHDCVECHRYHDGDHPLRGRGADTRPSSQGASDLQRFLSGP